MRIQKVNETLDSNIKGILNPAQLEIFERIKDNNGGGRKKSKKKSKKNLD
jgi:hypothetical protein